MGIGQGLCHEGACALAVKAYLPRGTEHNCGSFPRGGGGRHPELHEDTSPCWKGEEWFSLTKRKTLGLSEWCHSYEYRGRGYRSTADHRRACNGHETCKGSESVPEARAVAPARLGQNPALPTPRPGPCGPAPAWPALRRRLRTDPPGLQEHPGTPARAAPLTLESIPIGAGAGGRRRSLGPDHRREGALLFHCRDDIGR